MGRDVGAVTASETAGFRIRGFSSRELSPRERVAWREQIAAIVLADELAGDRAFWQHVGRLWAIHEDFRDDVAYEIARHYARGRRRRVVAELLARAASAPDGEAARRALLHAGVRAVFVVEGDRPRPSRYGATRGFDERIRAGARALARRGAGRCLACGELIGNGSTFCRAHDSSEHVAALRRQKIERDLRWAVDYAAPAILGLAIAPGGR